MYTINDLHFNLFNMLYVYKIFFEFTHICYRPIKLMKQYQWEYKSHTVQYIRILD